MNATRELFLGTLRHYRWNDGSIIFEAEVAGVEEIKFWIMSWGSKAQVLEPGSLKDQIRSETKIMLEEYSKDIERKEEPLKA